MLRVLALASYLLAFVSLATAAAERPILWGFGTKPCKDYLVVHSGWRKGDEAATGEFLRYRDWLAGFVSALSLATGEDVLHGTELQDAMGDIAKQCGQKPDADFFDATMTLVRALSLLRLPAGP